jgi:hypothetical protein
VGDVSFGRGVDRVLFEAEGVDQPVDCGQGIAIANAGDEVDLVCVVMMVS